MFFVEIMTVVFCVEEVIGRLSIYARKHLVT
jgi:hypothetical protein